MKIGRYTTREARQISIEAVRSWIRMDGVDPATLSATDAHAALDEMVRNPSIAGFIPCAWYQRADDSQMRLFARDWNAWLKIKRNEMNGARAAIKKATGTP